jgi:hypothetical protein
MPAASAATALGRFLAAAAMRNSGVAFASPVIPSHL